MYEIKPEVFTLSNGIRVVYLHAAAQVAHMGVTILCGSRFEENNEVGLAHFLEHCEGAKASLTDADMRVIEDTLPIGWAHGDRYSTGQWVGPENYC